MPAAGSDHDALFLREGEPAVYVTQPFTINTAKAREMAEFADLHGLEFYIDSTRWPNFHSPLGTTLAAWTRPGFWEQRFEPPKGGPTVECSLTSV